MSANEPCAAHFPADLPRLAENARRGGREPFVGTGHPDTVLVCGHGRWRLGDVVKAAAASRCKALTAAGGPCQGRGGADGLCAAHKDR